MKEKNNIVLASVLFVGGPYPSGLLMVSSAV